MHRYAGSISQRSLSNQFFVKNQVVSFRFPQASKAVVRTIKRDCKSSQPGKIRIYKNIQFHNKSQTNTPKCLDELFRKLSLKSQSTLHPSQLQLDLEFSDRHEDTMDQIIEICHKHGVQPNLFECFEVSELLQLIASSNICIAPIGSVDVVPTWVFHKPTVLHAESFHREQISWWHLAGNNDPSRQYLIPGEAIDDDPATAGAAYGSCLIAPTLYVEVIATAHLDYASSITQTTGLAC